MSTVLIYKINPNYIPWSLFGNSIPKISIIRWKFCRMNTLCHLLTLFTFIFERIC
jgi:hypothetical protein